MLAGSVWVMYHMNKNMMPMSGHEMMKPNAVRAPAPETTGGGSPSRIRQGGVRPRGRPRLPRAPRPRDLEVERRTWKLDLIAEPDARVHAAPVSAPGPAEWPGIGRDDATGMCASPGVSSTTARP